MDQYIPGETPLASNLLYKILPASQWRAAKQNGQFVGSGIDHTDGFIHLSGPDQVAETYAKHFAGTDDLMIFGIDPASLGESLRWEVSRGGAKFPHVYAAIEVNDVKSIAKVVAEPRPKS